MAALVQYDPPAPPRPPLELEQMLRQQLQLLEEAVEKHRHIAETVRGLEHSSNDGVARAVTNLSVQEVGLTSSRPVKAVPFLQREETGGTRPVQVCSPDLGCFGFNTAALPQLSERVNTRQEGLQQPLLDCHNSVQPTSLVATDGNGRSRMGKLEGLPTDSPRLQGISRWERSTCSSFLTSKSVFPSRGALKRRVQEALKQKPSQDVEELYSTEGICQRIARHAYFQTTILIVIMLNTVWMAIDTDYNKADVMCDAPAFLQFGNNFFCTCFLGEITVRFFAFRRTIDALTNTWFVFDAVLVFLMVWESWVQVALYLALDMNQTSPFSLRSASIFRLFRLFRLLRVARMSRLLRSVPELSILVKGMGVAMRSMLVTLSILILVIYIFAIMFTQLLSDSEPLSGNFGTVPTAMNFMLMQVLCGFDSDVLTKFWKVGLPYYCLWLLYVLLASLTIMNMLIGILCDVVTGTAESEKEIAVMRDIEQEVSKFDANGNGFVSAVEFAEVFENQSLLRKLNDLGVDVGAFADFASFMLTDGSEIPIADFIDMAAHFRGSDNATVKDILEMRRFMCLQFQGLLLHSEGTQATASTAK
mmetsp:Transcript_551/g.1772  ORF Transcript_551/g.1772 Transcript_551/m.1772 type:complete len:589 (+) Transcript_551:109-1875(+)